MRPIDKNKTNDVNPKVTPKIWGIVFAKPKLKPEYEATTLFGPGVYAVTNQNKEIDNISGCILSYWKTVLRFLRRMN
jgi:hypothetical protein